MIEIKSYVDVYILYKIKSLLTYSESESLKKRWMCRLFNISYILYQTIRLLYI